MAKPTITYGHGFLDDFDTFWGTTTGAAEAGGDATHTVDASFTEADDYWNGYYIKYTSGTYAGVYKLITDFDAATDKFTHLTFGGAPAVGDTFVISRWKETLSGMAAGDATPTIQYEDYLRITGVCDGAGDEYVGYERDITDVDTTIHPKLLVRWKTSAAANGLQAKVTVTYLAGAPTETTLGFSTTWTETYIDLTTGTSVDKITLTADDNPDTAGSNGTHYVYFDFVLICQGVFTWPFFGGIEILTSNRIVHIEIPGRVGDITQYLGSKDALVRIWGDIDSTGVDAAGVPVVNSGWHGRWTTVDAETFYQVQHYGNSDLWEWFTSDKGSFKVTIDSFKIVQAESNANLLSYEIIMHELRACSAEYETSLERYGLPQT